MPNNQKTRKRGKLASRHAVEWIFGTIGILVLCSSIGFLAYEALTQGRVPPTITVQSVATHTVAGGYLVELRLRNDGSATAAKLKVRGSLMNGQRTIEVSEATFDYLPRHSQREGGLFFSNNPEQYQLVIKAEGYEKP